MADDGEWDRHSLLRGAAVVAGAAATAPLLGEAATAQAGSGDADALFKAGNKFSLSVPRWQAAGEEIYAEWFAAVGGNAYQIHGDIARLPWQQLDPEPLVEASVNGGPPKRFTFRTGEPWLGMSAEVAKEAGLSPLYIARGKAG